MSHLHLQCTGVSLLLAKGGEPVGWWAFDEVPYVPPWPLGANPGPYADARASPWRLGAGQLQDDTELSSLGVLREQRSRFETVCHTNADLGSNRRCAAVQGVYDVRCAAVQGACWSP